MSLEVAVHYTFYQAVSLHQASSGDLYYLASQFLNKLDRLAFLYLLMRLNVQSLRLMAHIDVN